MASFSRLIPELVPWAHRLLDVATRAGVGPRVTSTYRTFAKQTQLYNIWKAGGSPYPVALPGTSSHEFGYAFDVALAKDGNNLADLGSVWESWGGVWGGRYGDPVHFEFPGFKSSAASGPARRCSPVLSAVASAVDFLLGFAPGIGEVELVATLVGFGFPRSTVLKYLQNPVSSVVCGSS